MTPEPTAPVIGKGMEDEDGSSRAQPVLASNGQTEAEPSGPRAHDRTRRGWGFDHGISRVRDGGLHLSLYGWGGDHEVGDYLILPHSDGSGQTARYRITSLRRPGNPPDQWFCEAEFAPRERSSDTSDVSDKGPGMKTK